MSELQYITPKGRVRPRLTVPTPDTKRPLAPLPMVRGPCTPGHSNTKPWPLSATDTKELARLVRKYGRGTIIAAAQEVPVRAPGRPSRGDLPYFERLSFAQMIEDWTKEHQRQGSHKPVKDALLDLYEVMYDGELVKPDIQKFLRTQKRKLIPARRELQALTPALRRMDRSLKKRLTGCE
jgi:hypothetical protein